MKPRRTTSTGRDVGEEPEQHVFIAGSRARRPDHDMRRNRSPRALHQLGMERSNCARSGRMAGPEAVPKAAIRARDDLRARPVAPCLAALTRPMLASPV